MYEAKLTFLQCVIYIIHACLHEWNGQISFMIRYHHKGNFLLYQVTLSLMPFRRFTQEYGGLINMVEMTDRKGDQGQKKESYSQRVYNSIMHSEESFQRRNEAIAKTKETRKSSYE